MDHSVILSLMKNPKGQKGEMMYPVFKNFIMLGKLTYFHFYQGGKENYPLIGDQGATLLVRKLLLLRPPYLYEGDVVVMRHPEIPQSFLVRRLVATEGREMMSTDEKDEPFILKKGHGWFLSENTSLEPKEAYDSRTFGPHPIRSIVGRVIYCMRTAEDHEVVRNNPESQTRDAPVLNMELDIEEMAKFNPARK
ncbi:hypothetical protein ACFE04_016194 [Oxalis oulophora]